MKAVRLAASAAERLHPFTETRAKTMIQVAGRPIMERMAVALGKAGVTELLIVVNHQREGIESYFGHGHEFGLSIEYVLQDPVDGIGAGVRRCEPALGGKEFLLVYGDVLATGPIFETLMGQYVESGGAAAAISLPASSLEFGNVYLNRDMKIVELVEKPTDPHLSNYVFAGAFVLPHSFLKLLDKHGNDIEHCYQDMIKEGALSGAIWDGGWIDVRRPWDILEANRLIMGLWEQGEIHQSVKMEGHVEIEGPVHIEQDVVIASGSVLKGPCHIGRGSYIGNNTLIREYSSLGPQCVVGYGTELKNCVLFGSTVLGRLSYIGDSVIGERAHLGTGVTTVNFDRAQPIVHVDTAEGRISTGMPKVGAFIGDDAYLGARQVLAPGTRIKAGQVVEDLVTLRSTI
ncbi:MAG: sugar phosphate nucleotidyltransferase [SAR324 cluster bacterium]|nr:sugar phosphate nucleotidyltransferase [SAR324 cluster bacterium]